MRNIELCETYSVAGSGALSTIAVGAILNGNLASMTYSGIKYSTGSNSLAVLGSALLTSVTAYPTAMLCLKLQGF